MKTKLLLESLDSSIRTASLTKMKPIYYCKTWCLIQAMLMITAIGNASCGKLDTRSVKKGNKSNETKSLKVRLSLENQVPLHPGNNSLINTNDDDIVKEKKYQKNIGEEPKDKLIKKTKKLSLLVRIYNFEYGIDLNEDATVKDLTISFLEKYNKTLEINQYELFRQEGRIILEKRFDLLKENLTDIMFEKTNSSIWISINDRNEAIPLKELGIKNNDILVALSNIKTGNIPVMMKGPRYYHYKNDPSGIIGDGWSCVYNNLQSLISIAGYQAPSLKALLKYFYKNELIKRKILDPNQIKDLKDKRFIWIEPGNAKKYLDENILLQEQNDPKINTKNYNTLISNTNISSQQKLSTITETTDSESIEKIDENSNSNIWQEIKKRSSTPRIKSRLVYFERTSNNEKYFVKKYKNDVHFYDRVNTVAGIEKLLFDHFTAEESLPLISDDEEYSYLITGIKYNDDKQISYVYYSDPHCWGTDIDKFEKQDQNKSWPFLCFCLKKWMLLFPEAI